MKRKHIGPVIFIVIVIVGLFAVLFLVLGLSSLKQTGNPLSFFSEHPSVNILMPEDGTVITSGQGLMVIVEAQSEVGLARVDFLVDGILEQQYISAGEASLQTVFPWFGSNTGWHTLNVVAYDLQGSASEAASVQAGVQAAAPQDQGDGIAGADDGQAIGDEIPNEDDNQLEGDVDAPVEGEPEEADRPQADEPAEADAPVQPEADEADQAPPELPPQPQDAPPEVTRFEVFVDVVMPPNGGEAVVTAAAVGSARDDLGLERLTFTWRNIVDQDGAQSIVLCDGNQACETDLVVQLGDGQWVLTLQAFDTSGQASPPSVEIIEVLAQQDQPPAAAEHDIDDDWLCEQFRRQAEDFAAQFDANDFFPWGGGLDLEDLLRGLLGNRGDGAPDEEDEPECDPQDWVCEMGLPISVSVEPGPAGNMITLTIDDALEAPAGQLIAPRITKSFAHFNQVTGFMPHEWVDMQRGGFVPGQQFTWLDEDVVCHEDYEYLVAVSAYDAAALNEYLNGGEEPRGQQNLAYEARTVNSQICGAGRVNDLQLTSAVHPEGVILRWNLPADADWPEDGVRQMLVRWNMTGPPGDQDAHNIMEEAIALDLLQQGGDYEYIDPDVECGNEYWYLLGVSSGDEHHQFNVDDWLAHASVPAPPHFCPEGQLADIELSLSSSWDEWIHGHYAEVTIEFDIPDDFDWPAGNLIKLYLWEGSVDEEGQYRLENFMFFPQLPDLPNFHRLVTQNVICSRQVYDFYLTMVADGQVFNEGPTFSIELPPCPPKDPPALQQLRASNDCGGEDRCIYVNWDQFEQAGDDRYLPAEQILIEKNTAFLNQPWRPIEVHLDSTQFIDTNVGCNTPYLYRMVAVDQRGLRRSSSNFSQPPMLRIDTPACDQPWDVVVEPELE